MSIPTPIQPHGTVPSLEHEPATAGKEKGNEVGHYELAALEGDKEPANEHIGAPVSKYAGLTLGQTLRTFPMAIVFALMAAFNAANDGYCYSIPGNVIAMPGFIAKFGKDYNGKIELDAMDLSMWGALYTVGYIVILFFGSPINDIIGRKWAMLLVQVFMLIGTLVSLFANTSGVWGAAKFFQGMSVGFAQASVQTYVSEVAPTRARGFLLAVYQLFFAFGQLTAAIATYVVNDLPADKWKHAIYSEFVLAGIAFLLWIGLPESPRWLARKGRDDKAKAVLNRINGRCAGYDVDEEYSILAHEVAEGNALQAASSKYSYVSMFKGTNLRRTLISFGPFAWQQWSGGSIIFGYSSYFFAIAGLENPFIGTLAVFLILLAGVFASMFAIEWFGRRPGLLVGGVGLTCAMLAVGALGTVKDTTPAIGAAIVFFSCLWVLFYSLTLAPIGYAMLAETSTVVLRAKTVSVAAGMTGLLNLVVNYCTPLLLSPTGVNWGVMGTSFFFGGTCFIGLVLIFFFVPETKGRSFMELDEMFQAKVSTRQFARYKTSAQLTAERV